MGWGLFKSTCNGLRIQALSITACYLGYGDDVEDNTFISLLGRKLTTLSQCNLLIFLQMLRTLEVLVRDEEYYSQGETASLRPQPSAVHLVIKSQA